MLYLCGFIVVVNVALRTEGVDRNWKMLRQDTLHRVALRTEGVDRNAKLSFAVYADSLVALRTEGVDRNFPISIVSPHIVTSPSVRRAWIEMCSTCAGSSWL